MAFHVYVEGALDQTPDGVVKLAQSIAAKFGLPAADIATRLSAGRFRVKANVDRATADLFARTLEELGARARVEEAAPGSGPISVPASGSGKLPASSSGKLPASPLPPGPSGARPSSSALPPPALPRTTTGGGAKPQMASGLAAAFMHSEPASADLGALGGDALSLASLDGNDDGAPVVKATADAGLPASIGPAATPQPPPPVRAKTNPIDLFAPPDAEADGGAVELATDEVEHRERKAAPAAPAAPTTPVLRPSQAQVQPAPAPKRYELTRPKFAAGVLLAIVIGFVPAHLVASVREKSAFAAIDDAVNRTQALATDEQSYAALDGFRSAQLSEKQSKHRSIALTSMLIWAAVSAGLAYVYFRRIPWETNG